VSFGLGAELWRGNTGTGSFGGRIGAAVPGVTSGGRCGSSDAPLGVETILARRCGSSPPCVSKRKANHSPRGVTCARDRTLTSLKTLNTVLSVDWGESENPIWVRR
jgi:hypothetical protein